MAPDLPNADRAMRVPVADLDRFCRDILLAIGADEVTADAVTRAIMHGSRLGIDSHGVRLLDHYVTVLTKGRVNPRPRMALVGAEGAVATLDAGNGHGAPATYMAMAHAVDLARHLGLGAVAVRNTSHFGPAGAYAVAAAQSGFIGVVMCNSDSFVRLHDGAIRFHGTNPIACAAPVPGARPWLLDMATSAIPYNRVQLYKSTGQDLPPGSASSSDGIDTEDPDRVAMLTPLGGFFGYKGAGLAGMIEIFGALLSGMKLSHEILPMGGPDFATPRGMGAFVLAIRPSAFVDTTAFQAGMQRYLDALRGSAPRQGQTVLAPGDREWAEADRRDALGIPIDPATEAAFGRLAKTHGVQPLEPEPSP